MGEQRLGDVWSGLKKTEELTKMIDLFKPENFFLFLSSIAHPAYEFPLYAGTITTIETMLTFCPTHLILAMYTNHLPCSFEGSKRWKLSYAMLLLLYEDKE